MGFLIEVLSSFSSTEKHAIFLAIFLGNFNRTVCGASHTSGRACPIFFKEQHFSFDLTYSDSSKPASAPQYMTVTENAIWFPWGSEGFTSN